MWILKMEQIIVGLLRLSVLCRHETKIILPFCNRLAPHFLLLVATLQKSHSRQQIVCKFWDIRQIA